MSNRPTQLQRVKYKKGEFVLGERMADTLILILRYDPDEDTIEIDAGSLSGLELREMVRMTYAKVFAAEEE